jgi:hypothetical protein
VVALLLLAALQESVADAAVRLAKQPKENRDALLALGPAAIRPLLDLKDAALAPVLDELRLAGAPDSFLKECRRSAQAVRSLEESLSEALDGVAWVDPVVAARKVPAGDYEGHDIAFTAAVCRAADVEYRYLRGRLVVSTAERLWAWPDPAKVDAAELKKAAAKLDDPAPDVRDAAARLLLSAGAASLPFLDSSDAESSAVAAKIRARHAPALFVETLAIERQALDDAGKVVLKALREGKAPIDFHGYAVEDAMQILFEKSEVKWRVAKGANVTAPSCGVRERPVIDAIWWLTVPYGLDAALDEGRLVVETRENLAKVR